jgi:methyl-accepting chemotaxis protein
MNTPQIAMTDQELKDLVANLAVKSDRLDDKLAELAQTLAQGQAQTRSEVEETARVVKEVSRRMGSMASNQGDVAEEFFYNTLFDKPEVGGIRFDRVLRNSEGAGSMQS